MSGATKNSEAAFCPRCGGGSGVKDSRPTMFMEKATIRRRRRCRDCGHDFTTYELSEEQVEAFLRDKLRDARRKLMDLAADL
jgi:transcriptional regulator NrdR family protein